MFSAIKSIGSKAISSLPGMSSSGRYKISPDSSEEQLQYKLKEISNLILKSTCEEQFKVYSNLVGDETTNFNIQLAVIYQSETCNTQKLVEMVRFYTFLLTNIKNELVVCKLVSEPLVIELTKIVLQLSSQQPVVSLISNSPPDLSTIHQIKKRNPQETQIKKYHGNQMTQQREQQQIMTGKQCLSLQQQSFQVQLKQGNRENFILYRLNSQTEVKQGQQGQVQQEQVKQGQLKQGQVQQDQGEVSGQSLNYLQNIDWEEVNVYKVALIRAYINCINSETVNYMITSQKEKYHRPGQKKECIRYRKELPIFNNCVSGYRNYLNGGVEGTCVSNCILMIINKVNLNDEVCDIIFQEVTTEYSEEPTTSNIKNKNQQITTSSSSVKEEEQRSSKRPENLLRRLNNRDKTIKIDAFIKEVVVCISNQLDKILKIIAQQSKRYQKSDSNNQKLSVKERNSSFFESKTNWKSTFQLLGSQKICREMEEAMEIIESNVLFCSDLINQVHNYNYTHQLKQAIGKVVEDELTRKVIQFVECQSSVVQSPKKQCQQFQIGEDQSDLTTPISLVRRNLVNNFSLPYLKLVKMVLNLSVLCSKEQQLVLFLNNHIQVILDTLLQLNRYLEQLYRPQTKTKTQELENIQPQENKEVQTQENKEIKIQENKKTGLQEMTQLVDSFSLDWVTKKTLEYMCTLALILLKQTISPFSMLASRKRLQVRTQIKQLKENILSRLFTLLEQIAKIQCLKKNICLKAVRNLLLTVFYLTIKEEKCEVHHIDLSPTLKKKQNMGLFLQFKYNILLLHKAITLEFHRAFRDNRNWQYIVNNYESLMREVPNTILSPEEKDKFCHFHNGNPSQAEDQIRNQILVCEAVRNYRYMIIQDTTLEKGLIRLENIYHRHFISPGWDYVPGQIIAFKTAQEYKLICNGFLHNNSNKLPVQVFQDFECLILTHRLAQNKFKVIANIRFKKIVCSVPESKHTVRLKLLGIQELLLDFSSSKIVSTFQEYVVQNRNRSRQKELKFISYYLGLYLHDSERLIQKIYDQELQGLDIPKDQQKKSTQQRGGREDPQQLFKETSQQSPPKSDSIVNQGLFDVEKIHPIRTKTTGIIQAIPVKCDDEKIPQQFSRQDYFSGVPESMCVQGQRYLQEQTQGKKQLQGQNQDQKKVEKFKGLQVQNMKQKQKQENNNKTKQKTLQQSQSMRFDTIRRREQDNVDVVDKTQNKQLQQAAENQNDMI